MRTPSHSATAGGLVAILLWSTTVALGRSLSERLGPLTAAAAVYLVAGVLGGLHRAWRSPGAALRPGNFSPRYLAGCGSLFALYAALLYGALGWARDRDDVLAVGLLNYLWPALTILLSLPLLGTRANGWLIPGTLLALAGIVSVCAPGGGEGARTTLAVWTRSPWACGLATAAALVWALYSNLARRWGHGQPGGAVELFLIGTGGMLLLGRAFHPEVSTWSGRAGMEALALGAMTSVAYGLWEWSMREGDFPKVAAASYFTPLLSTLVSAAYLGVVPGSKVWIGAVLLVAGAMLSATSIATGQATRASARRGPRR